MLDTGAVFPWPLWLAQPGRKDVFAGWYDLWLAVFCPIRPAPSRERVAGSLIGQCLGDALGFVVEGYSRSVCQEYVDEILLTDKIGTIGRAPHRFGQYTDDSQMARELMISYVARRGFDPDDYARRIGELFLEQRVVGRGRATTEAAARIANGVPWQAAGVPAPYAGNGAAMRAAPVGWMYPRRESAMLRTAQDQARITHTDPRAVAGSVAVAGAVTLALRARPEKLRLDDMIDDIARWVRPVDSGFAAEIGKLHGLRRREPEDAAWMISRAGLRSGEAAALGRWPVEEGAISPFVVPSVLWSLYAFLRAPDDYMESICIAIGGGGDTDTTAAMTGAISGAYLGLDAIPRPLAEQVHDDGTWGYDELLGLVDAFRTVSA